MFDRLYETDRVTLTQPAYEIELRVRARERQRIIQAAENAVKQSTSPKQTGRTFSTFFTYLISVLHLS
jgi:hypothetical protein